MRQAYRCTVLLGLSALSACGGGSGNDAGGGSSTATSHNFSGGGANVVTVTVGSWPAGATSPTFNIPLTSVKVCVPNTGTCATINDVLVDTGSSGLRLMASALAAPASGSPLTLMPMGDPNSDNGDTIQECLPFADGYAWGAVATATVSIGGETTSRAIPVQIIDDNSTPTVPDNCTSEGDHNSLDSVNAFDANGVLGVGTFNQDCGTSCIGTDPAAAYYSCPPSGCSTSTLPTSLALEYQVANPVASFPADNNGVILQLAPIPTTGQPTASGYLVFGIGTESNNGLGSATVLTADDKGNFTTLYTDLSGQAQTLGSSFIDSGSNGLYFPDSELSESQNLCGSSGTNGADFYCPMSSLNPPLSLSATNQGESGNTSAVSFQIASLDDIGTNNFAIDDVGGPAQAISGLGSYFDWGLPFFYDRTTFTAIEGATVDGQTYANGFYAY